MTKSAILDLVRVKDGLKPEQSLHESLELAQHAEGWGYERFWVAEHHNFPSIASAATSVVAGYLAAGTKTIRVGAGGVMLPNHSPLVVAEQFGTLARLYPGRIDLGLGRAPGTDAQTLRALRRAPGAPDRFSQDVNELQQYFSSEAASQPVQAVPAAGTEVPIWILGSSLFGADLAAELGLPYGFASHFAPRSLMEALDVYRSSFRPSARYSKPYVMVGANIIVAETDEEAEFLATSQEMAFTDLVRGIRQLLRPPIQDINTYWSAEERLHVQGMLAISFVGSKETVKYQLSHFLGETEADEVIFVSDIYDFPKRLRSYELAMECMKEL